MAEVSHTDLGIDESRAEVDTILTSASFARSPRAARLLHYLCSKYFAGEAADIKEYNIALDVLGRPDTFDPAQDAGVRVEVHRLRKKLREYYERDGSDHASAGLYPDGFVYPRVRQAGIAVGGTRAGPTTPSPGAPTCPVEANLVRKYLARASRCRRNPGVPGGVAPLAAHNQSRIKGGDYG